MGPESNFAYDVLRPVVVIAGWLISFQVGWMLRNWWIKRRERRVAQMRNVTPI